jgi:cysteine-rich repeat protein
MKRIVVVIASLLTLTGGCVLPPIGDALLVCTADADCPTSQVCVQRSTDDNRLCRPAGAPCVATIGGVTAEQPDGTACAEVEDGICVAGACVVARCGDGIVSGDETCDGGDGCRADCSRCGDGVVDDGEQCDNGRLNSDIEPGACRATCVAASCGDGVRDPTEGCDDGVLNSDVEPGACRTNCARPGCGDGVRDDDEDCDDGADNSDTAPGACRTTCVPGGCGDGVIDPGEVCDDGPGNSDVQPNACRTSCRLPSCGDRARDLDEACDDGDDNSDERPDACRTRCALPSCGDGVVDTGEACDEGAANGDAPDTCRATCALPSCGDGVIDAGERCDDGLLNSDIRASACRTRCVPASCGDGTIDAGEACDDGTLNSDIVADACRTTCARAACGDGVVDDGEVCDDGNRVGGDGCRADCLKVEVCGDGEVDPGEACDDDNDNPRDGCDACRRTTWAVSVPLGGRALADVAGFALTNPGGVAVDAVGGVYVADTGAHRVLRLDPDGSVVVIAGTGTAGFSGDDGPAIAAELRGPTDVAVAPDGVVFIADRLNDRIRSVDASGIIRTVAGGVGNVTGDGDGGPATLARLRRPRGLAANDNFIVVAEESGFRVRRISRTAVPLIETVAGQSGAEVVLPDGSDLFAGRLDRPVDVAFDGGALLVTEATRVRRIQQAQGRITTVAGGGALTADATSRLATSVSLRSPASIIVRSSTEFLFTDQGLRRVFRVTGNQIVAIAGTGGTGSTTVSTPLSTALHRPGGLAATGDTVIVVDEAQHRVRAFSVTTPTATMTELLGTGAPGVSIEGAAATSVTLVDPVAVVPVGEELLIADAGARRIFHRDAQGRLTTVAGNGDVGRAPEGALATASPVSPGAMVRRADGTLVIAENEAKQVRIAEIVPNGRIATLVELEAADVAATDGVLLTMDAQGRVVLGGSFGIAVENPVSIGGPIPGFTVFSFGIKLVAIASESPTSILALTSGGVLERITLDFTSLEATVTTIERGSFHESSRALAVTADGIFVGSANDGVRLRTSSGELLSVIPGGPGRTGDGGRALDATVADPAALAVDDTGRLIIVDGGTGTVRRLSATSPRVVETLAGDLHPPGPGALSLAALYAPQTLVLLDEDRLVVGGAAGRLLQVSLGAGGGVDVVVGHPSPSPTPLPGPGGLAPARFFPLLSAATAFAIDPLDPVGPSLKIVSDRRVVRIDTTTPPEQWEAAATARFNTLAGATSILRLDAAHIAVVLRDEHCVRRLDAATLDVVGGPLFGTCGSPGSFAGFVREPAGLVAGTGGTLYLADTGNHRVLRRDGGTGAIATVIGDGSPSSAGQGSPAREFPLQSPGQLALDSAGNLFIASTTTVRLVANVDGDADADGDDAVSTIYGLTGRDAFPQRDSRCLAGLVLDEDNDRLFVADACGGFLVALDLVALP